MQLSLRQVTEAYQRAIGSRFPSVRVEAKEERGQTIVEAFMVPDGQSGRFVAFLLDEVSIRLEKKGIPFLPVTPYSEGQTQQFFPKVYSRAKVEVQLQVPEMVFPVKGIEAFIGKRSAKHIRIRAGQDR